MKRLISILCATLFLTACSGSDSSGPDLIAIQTQAERLVKQSLKAPSTADFGGLFEVPEIIQHKDDPTIFWVFGKVTAQNSFGAELTQEYGVKMQKVCDSDTKASCWKALGVEVGN